MLVSTFKTGRLQTATKVIGRSSCASSMRRSLSRSFALCATSAITTWQRASTRRRSRKSFLSMQPKSRVTPIRLRKESLNRKGAELQP